MYSHQTLHELIYVSTVGPTTDAKGVAAIANGARIANRVLQITGVLVFDGERFCQFLEGRIQQVVKLFERISMDPRHESVDMLHQGKIGQRHFRRFSMGYPEQTWWTFTYMPLRDELGAVIGMMGISVDASAKVLAARQAETERERQRKLLQQMPGFVGLLVGPTHVYEYVNDAYRTISGERDFLGHTVREVFPELQGQGFFELLDQVYASGVPFTAQAMPIKLAGEDSERFIDLLYHPIRDETDAVMGIFVGGYDVTPRVQAEVQLRGFNETLENKVAERTADLVRAQESLRQSQKLEAIGQLTGGVAHDFNNFMSVIGSSVQLMLRKELPEASRRKYLETIHETVRRASQLTGQLLAFARQQPLRPEVFDVGLQAGNVVELLRPLVGSSVHIEFLKAVTACHALADIGQFESALMNLALNARDAVQGHGHLSIRIECKNPPPGTGPLADRSHGYIALIVSDSGVGIPAEQLDRVFQPFFTTKEVGKGTGLGLSQVFGFAQQSGGDVHVSSTPGHGATFTLYLPRADTPVITAPSIDIPPVAAPRHHGASILVVDDNTMVARMSLAVLEELGYASTWAADAAKALVLLAENDSRFDLLFSDIVMPGMNGVDLAKTVQQRYPDLPIVLTSGYSELFAEKIPKDLTLIQKPYTVDILARVMQQTIKRRRGIERLGGSASS